jgi:hypothetical protein
MIKNYFVLFMVIMLATSAFCQAPEKLSYQAVIRGNNNALIVNQVVNVQISILQGSVNGPPVYIETQAPSTNANGLISLEIGDGVNVVGVFSNINWANGPFFIQTETDPTGGTNYSIFGTSQLLSVPFALYAKTAETVTGGILETDPIFASSIAASIVSGDTALWNLDNDSLNEIQILTLSNDTLYLSNSGFVVLPPGFSGNYNDLNDRPNFQDSIATYGFDGNYNNLSNSPNLSAVAITGNYSDLINSPNFQDSITTYGFDGNYFSLSNTPNLSTVAISGNYADLTNRPNFQDSIATYGFDGAYSSLINSPNLALVAFSGKYEDLSDKPDFQDSIMAYGFDGDYTSLINLPNLAIVAFSGNYEDLSDKPDFQDSIMAYGFDGDYTSLINSPNLANVAISGDYNDLNNQPSIPIVPTSVSAFANDVGYVSTLNDDDPTNEIQQLSVSITGDTLILQNGGFVIIPGLSAANHGGGGANPVNPANCLHVPTVVQDITNPITGKIWMDRNLGASQAAISATDTNAYGDLYQWGRGADGHQCRSAATTSILSSNDQPGHGDFILISGGATDWRSPENINLWQGLNGINNPCPTGYRIPTETELNEELLSWSSQDSVGAFGSAIKLPLAGRRASIINSVGSRGDYWTSTTSGTSSRSLFFSAGGLMNTSSRALGLSIRCIKDMGSPLQGSINTIDCNMASHSGILTEGIAANSLSSVVPYTGGNGGVHNGQIVNSTGVLGITATLAAGTFANGSGNVTYTITGTPANSGSAGFALTIGGQSCVLTLVVNASAPPPTSTYPAGYVHCDPANPTVIVDVTNPVTGKVWMDRNLGASQAAISSTDANAYGDFFQWGRRADGHQCRTSPTTSILSSSDQPTHGDFILAPNAPQDWRSPQNTNLWQGVNGVNNPCPSGYRLPTETELNAEHLSWSSNDAAGAMASPLKLPRAGYRYYFNGNNNSVGAEGRYWSSAFSFNGTNTRYLYFTSSIAAVYGFHRASGHSIRCLKDNTAMIQGSINSLDCGTASNSGTLTSGNAASGVNSSIPYTGGNGGTHNGQTVNSTGVNGLTATLTAGTFANGSGNVTYTITGTPASSGSAGFALTIGGQSCVLTLVVGAYTPPPTITFPAGYVHCNPANPMAIVDVANPTTGKIWMDRNLGASQVAISSTDANAYGDLYQWGRGADGHQCRTSQTTSNLSSTDQPVNGSFITINSGNSDWRSPQNDNLWQGVNGLNNPCPSGYKIPTEAELNVEMLSWGANNASGAFASPLKLPMGGLRNHDNGSLSFVGTNGLIWSSTVNSSSSRSLFFNSSGALINTRNRAYGRSVRCIKEYVSPSIGTINTLDCIAQVNFGTLISGTAASGASSNILYTGGNGGTYSAQTVNSTGVAGLTASLAAGNFANGSGYVNYLISGTPTSSGTAIFMIHLGGHSCFFTFDVTGSNPIATYPIGYVHCNPSSPTDIVDVVNPSTNKIWMDRNLGASQVATSSTDANSFGDLFQWGRGADGHQCRNSTTTSVLSSLNQPGHGNFIIAPNTPNDWRSPANNSLWQGVTGVNNPCPSGYRLPSQAELAAEHNSWLGLGSVGSMISPLKLPLTGRRNNNNGTIDHIGYYGYYWSSTSTINQAVFLAIFDDFDSGVGNYFRSMGYSVRCIKN